jgi:hypothetical protein
MTEGWMTGDAPCWASNDHYWSGGVCTACGARLRCMCGRFIKVEDLDAHFNRGECRTAERAADSPETP